MDLLGAQPREIIAPAQAETSHDDVSRSDRRNRHPGQLTEFAVGFRPGAPTAARCQSGCPRLYPGADADRGLRTVRRRTQEDRDPLRRGQTRSRPHKAPITRPHRSTGRIPARGDSAELEAADKARRAGAPHTDGRPNYAQEPLSREPDKPNPRGHRVEAEKKTSPPVAAGILTTPDSDFFNTFGHRRTFRGPLNSVRSTSESGHTETRCPLLGLERIILGVGD